jgi:hypothetical protein
MSDGYLLNGLIERLQIWCGNVLDQYLGQVLCWLNSGPRYPTGSNFVSEPQITYICLSMSPELLNILCKFLILTYFSRTQRSTCKKCCELGNLMMSDRYLLNELTIDRLQVQCGNVLDQYLGQVRCWLKSGPRWPTGGHLLFQNPKSQNNARITNFMLSWKKNTRSMVSQKFQSGVKWNVHSETASMLLELCNKRSWHLVEENTKILYFISPSLVLWQNPPSKVTDLTQSARIIHCTLSKIWVKYVWCAISLKENWSCVTLKFIFSCKNYANTM